MPDRISLYVMEQLSISFLFTNQPKSDEKSLCPDVSRCSSVNSNEVRAPAKNLPKTFAERPTFDPPRAANRERQVWNACAMCGLWYAARACRLERGQGTCCSRECWEKHVIAHGVFKGANNPRWLGGVSNDNMRYKRRQIDRHPERVAARNAVASAVKGGRLIRQPCEVCGAAKVEGHHDDYSKPLAVRWLCPTHHDEHHARERAGA